MSIPTFFLLPAVLFLLLHTHVSAHGLMNKPNIRGSLVESKFVPTGIDNASLKDHWAHFPAGDRNSRPGSGLRSQIREAGPRGWTPFKPLEKNFKWRYGVCGDMKTPGKQQPHLRGGIYYNGGMITGTYRQGGVVDVSLTVVAHHNGYMELHICDVKKCDGEISEKCFRDGHCQQLERAYVPKCQTGFNKGCGPIDRDYPGRWYFPCSTVTTKAGYEFYGGGTIQYRLPENLVCEHCVLQWFWTAANSCNPPGVVEYFDGPDGPKWGNCKGQGDAVGGVTRVQRPCGPDRFPEEYIDCADVRILPRSNDKVGGLSLETAPNSEPRSEPSPTPSQSTTPSPEPSQSNSPEPKPSQSSTPRPKPSQSRTPKPSPKPSQSKTPRPSPRPSKSSTPRPSPKPSQSKTPRPSPKPSKSSTPRPSPKPSKSNTPKPSPKAFRNRRGKVSAKASSSPSPTASTKPDFDIYPSMEPSFSPEETAEEALEESMSPEPEWSLEPSGEDFDMDQFMPNERTGLISDLILVADGKDIGSVVNGDIINIADYDNIAFRAMTTRKVRRVDFYINGDKVWTEHHIEYYMFGNNKTAPFYWKEPPLNVWVEIITVAEDDEDVVNIMFTK